jgi:hypothetical protein
MLRNTRAACLSAALLLGAAGCNSFLTGDKLSGNPNYPTTSTVQTLFVGVQSGMYALHEGTVAMQICEWVQHCGGTNGRYVQLLGLYDYGNASNIGANIADWNLIYDQGGLIDLRAIEQSARAAGDSIYLGIAKIWEAYNIGLAADLWGSIPYTQAASPTIAVPDTDSQWVVYDSVQALLSEAIVELSSGKATLPTPPDLLFGGTAANWIAVANTLKARYWMHVANAAVALKHPRGYTGPQVYGFAITAALVGIGDNTGAGDFKSVHAGPTFSQNMWEQFQSSSGFGGDLEAGFPLVDYMKRRGDPRLAQYFCTNGVATKWKASTAYKVGTVILDGTNMEVVTVAGTSGATAPIWATKMDVTTTDGTVTWVNNGPPYEGDIWNNTVSSVDSAVIGTAVSTFACLPPARFGLTAAVPFVTYQENELILAEAYDKTGNAALAQTHLGNAYAAVPGLASRATGVVDPALLDSIMREKWVTMFQNVEALMDYERTCLPASVKVASGNFLNIGYIPGRLFYPNAERNLQPHIPLESQELAGGLRTAAEVPTSCHP